MTRIATSALEAAMMEHRDPSQVDGLMRFFKTGPGQYGEGDRFLGIRVPTTRRVVGELWRTTSLADVESCLASPWHEVRLAALLTLVRRFRAARRDEERQRECIDCYLLHTDRINNWDLVDLSCYDLLGLWLLDRDRTLLYDLARRGRTLWEQRIGIVTTMQFVRHGQVDDTLAIARLLLGHEHDLIHKAVGWLLREAGKRDEGALRAFLDEHATVMPRTMLRYAIERLPDGVRRHYMTMRAT